MPYSLEMHPSQGEQAKSSETSLIPYFDFPEARDPQEFFQFLRNIPIETLLDDRVAQATLHKIMDFHTTHDSEFSQRAQEHGRIMLINPFPVVILERENGAYFENRTFMLKDNQYYYYFHTGWPIDNLPDFLRLEDLVGSGMHAQLFPDEVRERIKLDLGVNDDQLDYLIYSQDPRVTAGAVYEEYPFNKPINRVPVRGGVVERFNTRKWEWEPNNDGVYKPELKQRLRIAGHSFVGKLRGSSRTTKEDRLSLPESPE